MRVGLLGAGRIGAWHARFLSGHPLVAELVIGDADARRAEALAGPLGARAADPDAVLAAGLDAVLIATPTATHADLLVRACEAGVPVFCEKPVAPDLRTTLEVRDRAAKTGVPVHIGFQRRFDAGYAAARQAVLDGRLGDLHRVHLVTADPAPPPAEYVASSGGIFRDCHIHDFDILRWVTGREVASVTAVGANRGDGYFADARDVDTSAAVMVLDDGTIATMQGSRYNGAGYDVRMELSGTAGTWVVGLDERAALRSAEPGVDWPSGDAWTNFWDRFEPAYASEIGTFLDVARGHADSPCTIDEALEALLVAEAATLSLHEERQVRPAELR
ncbi:Gfo/Idh/MocA family protein [Actinomadura violacea]|uniref:Gfo/Idh/MocA family oxidoreductase n=1 Tax=Actinomadura violacea TaxID=2819934 RepID=A0ABS3RNZ2_9ACTN|nr:Gfo/Idh/MocA family oxidoreductase [Actinomadura violacea]MBO2458018.1 Gfo/Idh/MocA family oxidoreductase [Actinomadura violacea]